MELTLEYQDQYMKLHTYKNVMLCHIRERFEMQHAQASMRVLGRLAKAYPGAVLAISFVSANTSAADRPTRQACASMLKSMERDLVAWGIFMEADGLMATMIRSAVTFIMTLLPKRMEVRLFGRPSEARGFVKAALRTRGITHTTEKDIDQLWASAFEEPGASWAEMQAS